MTTATTAIAILAAAILLASVANVTRCASIADKEKTEALRFLRAYGFLEDTESSLSSDNATTLSHALALFQDYYRLHGNGTLTADTLRLMRKPRCGLRDVPDRAFSPILRKWPKTHLTWNFQAANKELLRISEIAFATWSANSSLTFARDTLHPDILISYRTGNHTYANRENGEICPAVFDGPGVVLAHAFFPTGAADFASEVHIDNAEPWYIFLDKNPPNTYHLLQTLVHEIGHALGLQHSLRTESVMFAYIPDNEHQFPVRLSIEDILAIQNLYGANDDDANASTASLPAITTTVAPITTAAPNDPANADLCALRHFDAALIVNHRLYIAHRRNVWSISITERRYGKPMQLTDYARFLPANFKRLSAAYQRPSGDLALFVDASIYLIAYPSLTLRLGYPKPLSKIGLPPNARINAAINTHTGRTYVIYDDDKVAEIDECFMTTVKHSSLADIFPGIPPAITSAFRHADGHLYFFTKRQFYAFNEFTNTVTLAGPFDLYVLGIECPTDGLLRQLRDLLDRVYRLDLGVDREDEIDDEYDR